jgi:SAM-dependent methyltransferase
MPLLAQPRQPDGRPGLHWFGSLAGQGLLAAEYPAGSQVLAACPALPWAWIGVAAAEPPPNESRRGLLLHRSDAALAGAVRCGLPLPLASESLGAVLVQHALDDGVAVDEMLRECERVLAPGGTLWLTALNPWSPYRLRWAGEGLRARHPGAWQAALRRAGFAFDAASLQWLGPHWRVEHGDGGIGAADRLRAGIALTVNKRVRAGIPPSPLRTLRWQTGHLRPSETVRREPVIMEP